MSASLAHELNPEKTASRSGVHDVIRMLVKLTPPRLASGHQSPFPSFKTRGENVRHRNRFLWKACATMVAIALLTFALPLRAQSLKNLVSDTQTRSVPAELQDDDVFRTPEIGPGSGSRSTFTAPAVGGAVSPTVVPVTLSLGRSGILAEPCAPTTYCAGLFSDPERSRQFVDPQPDRAAKGDEPDDNSKPTSVEMVRHAQLPDFNQSIYYKNKLEFSFESGYLPINIPWVYDFAVGDGYTMTPLKYTLVPVIASLRWHLSDVGGLWVFRGNWDLTFSGSVTLIPRGPETHYFVFIFGVRRNFVRRNWRIAPYFDQRGGIGNIDAKEPLGVLYAQGQDLTFTYNIGAGARYNLSPRYSISAGVNYMHISNGYLSEPAFTNYGINVYGPMFGIDVRIGKPRHRGSE
jgi:lipid A 3-O-deacylase PagL